ncbi:T9SS type A sorting domain-containing protein [Candidatus Poribacteria bacterium]|nr:T9SS type A sorting domain-containing protein [Candidatus Poribacteria bacterium]
MICIRECYCMQIKLAKVKPGETVRRDFLMKPECCGQEEVDVFELLDNYPEPSNPETWIPYKLPEDAEVTIRIYSATGQLVRTLNPGRQTAGAYIDKNKAAYWDGRNDEGSKVASGVYFYTLQAGKYTATRKMTLLK